MSVWYIVGVLAIIFVITLSLRAVPFVILKPLRESRIVRALGGRRTLLSVGLGTVTFVVLVNLPMV